jgi:hypothetical protein
MSLYFRSGFATEKAMAEQRRKIEVLVIGNGTHVAAYEPQRLAWLGPDSGLPAGSVRMWWPDGGEITLCPGLFTLVVTERPIKT